MLDVLKTIVQEINTADSFRDVLHLIVKRVRSSMGTGICSVYLYDDSADCYVLRATEGLNQSAVGAVKLKSGEGLVGLVAAKAEPVNLEFADQHPNFAFFPETGEERFRSFLGAPIIHQREVLGVLIVQEVDGRRFDESEEAFLVTVSAQLAGVIAHARAIGELDALEEVMPNFGAPKERVFWGVPSAPGIGFGTAVVLFPEADLNAVPIKKAKSTDKELKLFKSALSQARADMVRLENEFADKLSTEEQALFGVYLRMLDDHSLGGEVTEKIQSGLTAQSAWAEVVRNHVKLFQSMEDEYLRERATDVSDLGKRVLSYLQKSEVAPIEFPDQVVLIGEELSATAFAKVPVEKIVGIVSVKGSANSHLAILGRAMGIPTIMGAVDIPWAKMDGVATIVDGNRGQIVTNPGVDIHDAYLRQMEEERTLADDLEQLRDKPCITVDNQQVGLWVNTGLRIDALLSIDKGAEGVGLYRTEIPFLMQDRFPSEEEQRKIYREQLEMFAPRIVTMRTLDIGGDKALPYFPIVEANPFLGWRGIRITLDHPEIFLLQVRAMMRASEGLNNLRILLPMISNTEELDESLRLIDQAFNELTREEGVVINKPEVGVMIEVPAAVFQVREFSERVDFLSVGTNDLTQYLLAVDRNNPRVADLYHSYHPALLRALREIAAVANAQGTPVSVCGEMAGDPLGAVILAALGYRVLSMSATSLLRVKAMLSQVSLQDAHKILEESLKLSRPEDVKRYVVDALSDPQTSRLMGASSTA